MTLLALEGGEPVSREKIPISKNDVGREEANAALKVIESGWVTEGPKTKEFEEKFAKVIGTKHAIAVNSGTAALHLLVKTSGLKKGMKVAVPSFTFIASANCLLYEGLIPVFVEIDEKTYNINIEHLKKIISQEKIDAVMVVDLFGHPADWDEINTLATESNAIIIEDAAESHIGSYKGKRCGVFGKGAAFSFYPTKNMTTGEGGIITTDDDEIAHNCRKLKNHGRLTVNEDHELLGYNYRMSDVLAAIGTVQVEKVEKNVEKRRKIAQKYTKELSLVDGIITPIEKQGCKHSYMNYVLRMDSSKFKKDRNYFVKALNAEGIGSKVYFDPPIHLQPLYKQMFKYKGGELPITEKVAKEVFSLPMSSTFTDKEVDNVIAAVKKVAKELRK